MNITRPMTPVVAAIGRLNITGNVTPHVWYLRSEFRSGANRPDRNMITAVADILYWYRPREVRGEEQGGLLVGYERKFQRDMLQYNYGRRAAVFGMSEREMREACNRAQKAGLIRIEYRTERVQGRLLHNIVYVEPIPEAIAATLEGSNVGPVVKKNGARQGRHVQMETDVDGPSTESIGVDNEAAEILSPVLEQSAQNFGRFISGGELKETFRNSGRSTSQNFVRHLPKFWETYHETSPEISCPREGGVLHLEGDARTEPHAPPAVAPNPAPYTTTFSNGQTAETTPMAGHEAGTGVAVPPPDGGAVTDSDLTYLFSSAESGTEIPMTSEGPEVPRAVATVDALTPVAPAELAGRPRAVPGKSVYRLVVGLVGGKRAIEAGLLDELTPSGAMPRRDWLKLTEEELALVRETAQAEARATRANFQTLAIRGLDRLIGAPVKSKATSARNSGIVTLPGAYLTREEKEAQAAQFEVVEAGQQWRGRRSGKRYTIEEVTT